MPRAAELGFDVVLLPPFPDGVPPTPEAGALAHPAIGTMSDVAALVGAARTAGLELALDVAVNGTRHHGYATDHPEWFRRSPDGRFKQALQNGAGAERLMLDLDGESWETIWEELRRVVLFWVRAGVRVFRMDRPDETPLAFWEWLVAEVHREHPDVIFVAGSARPAVLARLAKIGFTQSEIVPGPVLTAAAFAAGLDGLHETPLAETLRLHIAGREGPVAPNDVDRGGRRLRLALAATLGSTYRVDDVDADALDLPGPRGWPDLARRLNAIRRVNPAFRTGSRVARHHSDNPALFCFSRVSADGRDRAIVVVNLDAVHMQHGFVHVPAASWGLPAAYTVTDELGGGQFTWKDGANYVRLDPAGEPAHILAVS
jgi:starch synthase (maltosyl-transferring)